MKARLLDHVGAHQKVAQVEVGGAKHVHPDAADLRCEMDHDVWRRVREQLLDVLGTRQVVVRAPGGEDVLDAARAQAAGERAPEEARSPRNEDGLSRERGHDVIVRPAKLTRPFNGRPAPGMNTARRWTRESRGDIRVAT